MKEVIGSYNMILVALSIIISVVASYTSFDIKERIAEKAKLEKTWLIIGSSALAVGIWSTHYIGMTALRLPIMFSYNWWMTLLSVLPPLAASMLAFYLLSVYKDKKLPILLAGIAIGLGISVMHYLSMKAITIPRHIEYDLFYVSVSTGGAVFFASAALFVFSFLRIHSSILLKTLSALLMGAAVTSAHYIGMKGISFFLPSVFKNYVNPVQMDTTILVVGIIIGSGLIFNAIFTKTNMERTTMFSFAYYDSVTGIPNRRLFELKLAEASEQAAIKGRELAVIYMDFDRFKWINGTAGHAGGDHVLKEFAKRVKKLIGKDHMLARVGGDEFILLLPKIESKQCVIALADQIIKKMQKPIFVENNSFVATISAGITIFPTITKEVHTIIRDADQALSYAKQNGRNHYQLFNEALHCDSLERKIGSGIRTALENNEFQLFYQPKVKSENGEIAGVEALIRWKSNEFGNVSPSLFIPIVEKNGLIIELTEWVMMTACRQMKRWREEGVRIEKVAVNISAVLFHYHDLIGMVQRVLKETKLPPSMLELEITETGLMENIENAILTLEKLQKMGVSIALDDFGTGISSLTYLKKLPLNTLKIDKSFIDGIPINEKDTAIMETILKLAENLDLTVVAEGVEAAEQVEFLKRKTCHYIQGYFFGRPLPPDEVKQMYGEKQASDFIIVTN